MIVKKFQAPTEREAIIKAQEELGSTAVVLNVKIQTHLNGAMVLLREEKAIAGMKKSEA